MGPAGRAMRGWPATLRRRRRSLRRRAHAAVMGRYGPVAVRYVRRARRWRWRGLVLDIPVGVFHPGLFFSTTVLAAELQRRELAGRRVLDVGCGSGLLALTAARAGATSTALDVHPDAVAATAANARRNGLEVETVRSDLFSAVAGRRFDLIVVNPPYFARDPVDEVERAWFAGADLGYFERFFGGLHTVSAAAPAEVASLMVLAEGCDLAVIEAAAARHGWRLTEAVRRRRWLGEQVVYEIRR